MNTDVDLCARSRQARDGNTDAMTVPRIPCVGAIITDHRGWLLLIKRGHEPGAGLWSLPGGRIEPDETGEQAVVREIPARSRSGFRRNERTKFSASGGTRPKRSRSMSSAR